MMQWLALPIGRYRPACRCGGIARLVRRAALRRRLGLWWLAAWLLAGGALADEPEAAPAFETDLSCLHFGQPVIRGSGGQQVELLSEMFDAHEGKAIRNIRVTTREIFNEDNPDEDNWLYRLFNRLHITTRETTVSSQLLFAEGDPVNGSQIRESERLLRRRGYLTSAYIVPDAICDDAVDVHVITRDAWVTEPEFAFGHEGGDTRSGAGVKDGNFLGTGTNISIGYQQDQQRSSIYYDYSTAQLFNTRVSARVSYVDKSDGQDRIVNFERPFYALDTPWATGVRSANLSEVKEIRSRGDVINEFRHRSVRDEAYFGIGASDDSVTHRWLLGISRENDHFSRMETTRLGIPDERKAVYPWWEYQYLEDRYGVYRNVHQIQREEDLLQGAEFRLRLGYGGKEFDNDADILRYQSRYYNMLDVEEDHILEFNFYLDGRYYPQLEETNSFVAGGRLEYHYFISERRRWYVSASMDTGNRLNQYEELTVGGPTGLRGYPAEYQRGDKRYRFTVERRHFYDVHLWNVVRMGSVMFFDMGKAWSGGDSLANPNLANLGLGLRLSSSKARVGNLLHLDVAMPLAARSGLDRFQLSIKASGRF